MKKVFIKMSVLSIALVVAASCTKTGPAGPAGATGATGATGPILTGNMQGSVILYDVNGSKILPGGAHGVQGASVVITNNSTGTSTIVATDGSGAYAIANLTTGTYSMTASLPSYGSVVTQGIQFAGGGNANRNFALSVVPTTSVTSALTVDTNYAVGGAGNVAENYVKIRGYVPVSSGGSTVIVFVSTAGATSASSTNFSTTFTTTISPGTTGFKITIPTANLYDLGFTSGNTVYFAAYIVGSNTAASTYVDVNTGQTVYTALSATPLNLSALVQ